jgi:hypothetical protein
MLSRCCGKTSPEVFTCVSISSSPSACWRLPLASQLPPRPPSLRRLQRRLTVSKPWIDQETPVRRYTAEASVLGATCQQGVAVLVIRQREGTPIYTWVGQVDYLFGLKDAADPAAMKTALLEWIDQGAEPEKTGTLPAWEETDGQPKRTEFPFMPIEGTDKATWDQLKKDNLDMFCFPQGIESANCAALRPGEDGAPPSMEEIGVQLFPG